MGTVRAETGSPARGRPRGKRPSPPCGGGAPPRASPPPRSATRVTSSLTSFTDWRWCTGRHKNCVALRPPSGLSYHRPLLASYDFQGSRGLKQKRKLSPGPDASGRKPDPVTRVRHTYDPDPSRKAGGRAGPSTGHGIITVFPFATAFQYSKLDLSYRPSSLVVFCYRPRLVLLGVVVKKKKDK